MEAKAAVKELNDILDAPRGGGKHVPGFVFKENTVLLMHNARYLHSHTDIKDPKRWLRRVRFHGTAWSVKEQDDAATSWIHSCICFPSISATAASSHRMNTALSAMSYLEQLRRNALLPNILR